MYSRYSAKNPRYSPPPGYTGSAFSGEGEVKHHLPCDEVAVSAPPEVCEDVAEKNESPVTECEPHKKGSFGGLGELIESIKDKFGTEELIILAVMLLIAQDGIGVEVLILGLILLAG